MQWESQSFGKIATQVAFRDVCKLSEFVAIVAAFCGHFDPVLEFVEATHRKNPLLYIRNERLISFTLFEKVFEIGFFDHLARWRAKPVDERSLCHHFTIGNQASGN